jgi:hypothetical protein
MERLFMRNAPWTCPDKTANPRRRQRRIAPFPLFRNFHGVEKIFHGVDNFFHAMEKSAKSFPCRGRAWKTHGGGPPAAMPNQMVLRLSAPQREKDRGLGIGDRKEEEEQPIFAQRRRGAEALPLGDAAGRMPGGERMPIL